MPSESLEPAWDFDSAIRLLHSYSRNDPLVLPELPLDDSQTNLISVDCSVAAPDFSLGDFRSVWDYLGRPHIVEDGEKVQHVVKYRVNDETIAELDAQQLGNRVRWRDEIDGADLEDNVEAESVARELTASNVRTQKRAARRARAKEKAARLSKDAVGNTTDTATDVESGNELESLRKSPDRRAIIQNILGRPRPSESSPPTSPSPPKKVEAKSESKSESKPDVKKPEQSPSRSWPVSNPFVWAVTNSSSPSHRTTISPNDGLTPYARKSKLISQLSQFFPNEKKYLASSGLTEPAFTPLNVSPIGVHVFVDMSNISIGFHDCLKVIRDIPVSTRVRRVPMNFHNFSLVLERGRPAAKRVVVGSDRTAATVEAKNIGYETNMLERVQKAKELTPRQKKYLDRDAAKNHNNNGNVSGPGETSGSETNNGYSSSYANSQPAKWVEQAVDEILHLKMLESLLDADKPSVIVLATGDAAEAEYSGGFMRMVERALEKGWAVELVSFRMNTSSSYKRREFRNRWGPMFKWIQLDDFAECLIEEEAHKY